MKNSLRYILICALTAATSILAAAGDSPRYAGGDISLLPDYEKAGAQYKTTDGKPIADLIPWLHEQGMNAMRVRLFVNPSDYTGTDADPNACQTMDYILPLCKRIKDSGMALMLDFHYSDTWADPAKQWTPKAWASLTDEELYKKIYDYTKESLQILNEAGATPDFIQPGNEISYGMLWGPQGTPSGNLKKTLMGSNANWDRLGKLLSNAIKACREECPKAQIVIHTERVAAPDVQRNFYDKMASLGIDYDIIGLSYYPYFHGNLNVLERAINSLEARFQTKKIMIVETGYAYKWEVPGTTEKVDYPYSEEGQNQFAKELVDMLLKHQAVDGLFWWWLEYNAYATKLSGWYNAPLFNSENGRACPALKTICSFATDLSGITQIESDRRFELPSRLNPWFGIDGATIDANPEHGKIYITPAGKILY